MVRDLVKFLSDDSGQGIVEYALIIAMVSVVAVAALNFLGKKASNTLNGAGAQMQAAVPDNDH